MLSRIDKGVIYMLLGALISALNGAITKILTEDLSALEVVFFRNLLGVVIILYALKHTPPTLNGGKFHLLLMRGVFGFLAMILFFYTITVIPLGEAITLNKTSPLFVTILAFYLLKERLTKTILVALFIGFIGILLITKPLGISISYEHFIGILGGFFAATAYTTIKKIKDMYDARIIVLSFVGVGSVAPLLLFMIAPYVKVDDSIQFMFEEFRMPNSLSIWLIIAFMAFISTLSQWLLTKAYSASNVGVIGVVSYTNIPFAIGFGWMLGDRFPDYWTFLGISFIILGGILVGRRKQKNLI